MRTGQMIDGFIEFNFTGGFCDPLIGPGTFTSSNRKATRPPFPGKISMGHTNFQRW